MTPALTYRTHASLAIRKTPAVRREEFLDFMTFQANARPLFDEIFGPLIGLKEEWTAQGATPEELDFSAFRYRCPLRHGIAAHTGPRSGLAPAVLEETDEHILSRDGYGRTMKLMKGAATLPLPLDHPVRDMDDWRRIKHWYAFSEARFAPDWEAEARARLAQGAALQVAIPGGFDEPRQLMGEEALCLAYYDQPELIRDMLETIGETACRVIDRVSRALPVDILYVHEDMAGKSGPLAGPAQIREFIQPYYRRAWDLVRGRGARLFLQDSDGDMTGVIPAFLDAGLNAMLPLEPAAGMDIVALRARYGTRLAFWGGLDKHALRRAPADIDRELLYKVPPMLRTGGCILALDHRIPNGVPLANYRHYIRRMWELLESAPS